MRIALAALLLAVLMSTSNAVAQATTDTSLEAAPTTEVAESPSVATAESAEAPSVTATESTSAAAYAAPLSRREQIARDGVPAHDRTNWNLVAPGIALLAGGWAVGWLTTIVWNIAGTSCTGSLFSSVDPYRCTTSGPYGAGIWQMAIPIVGPWLTFIGSDTYRGADIVFPVAMGLMQPIGLVLLIVGLTSPEHVAAQAPTAGQVDVHVGLSSLSVDVHF